MLMDTELSRVLLPKITLAAAIRLHQEYVTRAAIAAATMPLNFAAWYWETWADVYSPGGRK